MELKILGLFFLGISIGSLNPYNHILGWLIPLIISTIFIILDLVIEYKSNKIN